MEEDKRYRMIMSVLALVILALYMLGIVDTKILLYILGAVWVFMTARQVLKYIKEGNTVMAVLSGLLGCAMILLILRHVS